MKLNTFGKFVFCDFGCGVRMLTRPYYEISETKYNKIMEALKENETDLFWHKDKLCTVGHADGGFAIMPLNEDASNEMLRKFGGLAWHETRYNQAEVGRFGNGGKE